MLSSANSSFAYMFAEMWTISIISLNISFLTKMNGCVNKSCDTVKCITITSHMRCYRMSSD